MHAALSVIVIHSMVESSHCQESCCGKTMQCPVVNTVLLKRLACREVLLTSRKQLRVDVQDITVFDPELSRLLQDNPSEYLPLVRFSAINQAYALLALLSSPQCLFMLRRARLPAGNT